MKATSPDSSGADTDKIVTTTTVEALRQQIRRSGQLKGRQANADAIADVRSLIGPAPHRRDLLIEYLHQLNDTYRCLHDRHLVALAQEVGLSMAEVFEVASFYHHFELVTGDEHGVEAAPRLTVRVCNSLSCELAGAQNLLARLPDLLGADVRVVAVPCVGRCDQAPVAVVHQRPVPFATPENLIFEVNRPEARHPRSPLATQFIASNFAEQSLTTPAALHEVAPAYLAYDSYREQGGYGLAAAVVNSEEDAQDILQAIEGAGLRGLGGAGFEAARKWRIVRAQPGPRALVVNIDEGEPGTFKDRSWLERDPHRFLEGMLIAAQVAGTESCTIYLRDEYHGCRAILQTELARLQANPPCPLPQIELRRGAGAYICGEESALLESIEGKRGEPRMRPPYIAEAGLFGRPTLMHNLETLYWVRDIIEKGPKWFSSFGRNGRTGLRSYSVSGRVRHPGVKLAPAGITVRELIDDYCGGMLDGHRLYAYLPGGASGGILPASLSDVPLDFDTLQPYGCFIGSAGIIVLGQHDLARNAALNMMKFFAHESCGQCTPCRVGTAKAVALMQAPVWDNATLNDLNQVMLDASICGLGQAAPNPVQCVQKYFPHEIGA